MSNNSNSGKPWNIYYPRTYKDREGKEQTEFLKVGVAFPHQKGDGFNCEYYFRMLPSPKVVMFPPSERESGGGSRGGQWSDD